MKYNAFENNSSNTPFDTTNPLEIEKPVRFIEHILEDVPPNKSIEINLSWYKMFSDIRKLTIDDYCKSCDKLQNFISTDIHSVFEVFDSIHNECYSLEKIKEYTESNNFCIDIKLRCAKCGETHYYTLIFNGNSITKIGQYPSFTGKEKHELEKYKNIISKYYIELIRSVNAYSQHMGIAAFVYLRRIYEHIVETEYAKLSETDINNKASFDEKMKIVDKQINIIPTELDAHKSKIYSVLSKGIHEYEEEECYEMYPMMKAIIIIILDKYLSEKEKKKKLNDLGKFLSRK